MQTICKVARRVKSVARLSQKRDPAILSTIWSVSIVPARARTGGPSRLLKNDFGVRRLVAALQIRPPFLVFQQRARKQLVGVNLSLQIVRNAGHKKVRAVRVGVDTGGTFTDFVYETNGWLQVFKLPSTPDDPSRAIAEGLKRISEDTRSRISSIEVVHGTTVGTNALLQRRGARTALVTTAG